MARLFPIATSTGSPAEDRHLAVLARELKRFLAGRGDLGDIEIYVVVTFASSKVLVLHVRR